MSDQGISAEGPVSTPAEKPRPQALKIPEPATPEVVPLEDGISHLSLQHSSPSSSSSLHGRTRAQLLTPERRTGLRGSPPSTVSPSAAIRIPTTPDFLGSPTSQVNLSPVAGGTPEEPHEQALLHAVQEWQQSQERGKLEQKRKLQQGVRSPRSPMRSPEARIRNSPMLSPRTPYLGSPARSLRASRRCSVSTDHHPRVDAFYFPAGVPLSPSSRVEAHKLIDDCFRQGARRGVLNVDEFAQVTTEICGLSSYCNTALFLCVKRYERITRAGREPTGDQHPPSPPISPMVLDPSQDPVHPSWSDALELQIAAEQASSPAAVTAAAKQEIDLRTVSSSSSSSSSVPSHSSPLSPVSSDTDFEDSSESGERSLYFSPESRNHHTELDARGSPTLDFIKSTSPGPMTPIRDLGTGGGGGEGLAESSSSSSPFSSSPAGLRRPSSLTLSALKSRSPSAHSLSSLGTPQRASEEWTPAHAMEGLVEDVPMSQEEEEQWMEEQIRGGTVSKHVFTEFFFRKLAGLDPAQILFRILCRDPEGLYLERYDFQLLIHEIISRHPGLQFLESTPEFQTRYGQTVVCRIFYTVDRQGKEKITVRDLQRSDFLETLLLLDQEDDINMIHNYFSYEHFYVIYCQFWSLDADHDGLIGVEDLLHYEEGSLSRTVVDRIVQGHGRPLLSGVPNQLCYEDFVIFFISEVDKTSDVSIDYWMKIVDTDADSILSTYELELFFKEQQQRLEGLNLPDPILFQDILCQLIDMVKPVAWSELLSPTRKKISAFDAAYQDPPQPRSRKEQHPQPRQKKKKQQQQRRQQSGVARRLVLEMEGGEQEEVRNEQHPISPGPGNASPAPRRPVFPGVPGLWAELEKIEVQETAEDDLTEQQRMSKYLQSAEERIHSGSHFPWEPPALDDEPLGPESWFTRHRRRSTGVSLDPGKVWDGKTAEEDLEEAEREQQEEVREEELEKRKAAMSLGFRGFTKAEIAASGNASAFFNTLFNLNKFLLNETKNAQAIHHRHATPDLSDWDRFAVTTYYELAEEEEGQGVSDDQWDSVLYEDDWS